MKTWIKNILIFVGCVLFWMIIRFCFKGTIEPLFDSLCLASSFGIGVLAVVRVFQKSLTATVRDRRLQHQIQYLKTKIESLMPKYRSKRGLINIAGKGLKWLYGTMDDEDRQEIEQRLNIGTENVKNLIQQSNTQIKINKHFDEQLTKLTQAFKQSGSTSTRAQDLRYELDHIEKIVEQARELILNSQLRTLSRDILNEDEIIQYDITLDKLRYTEMDLATHELNIYFIIKIPNMSQVQYKQIFVQPIPNKDGKQIKIDNNTYLTRNYSIFEQTIQEKHLKQVTDECIRNILKEDRMKCTFETSSKSEIIEIGTNVIIIINGQYKPNQTCNNYPQKFYGNYALYIENCNIYLDREYAKKEESNELIIPNYIKEIIEDKQQIVNVKELTYEHIKNIEEIKEIKYHKITTYSTITIVIISIILIIITCIILKNKQNKQKTKVTVNIPLLQQDHSEDGILSRSGGVLAAPTPAATHHKLPFE